MMHIIMFAGDAPAVSEWVDVHLHCVHVWALQAEVTGEYCNSPGQNVMYINSLTIVQSKIGLLDFKCMCLFYVLNYTCMYMYVGHIRGGYFLSILV